MDNLLQGISAARSGGARDAFLCMAHVHVQSPYCITCVESCRLLRGVGLPRPSLSSLEAKKKRGRISMLATMGSPLNTDCLPHRGRGVATAWRFCL